MLKKITNQRLISFILTLIIILGILPTISLTVKASDIATSQIIHIKTAEELAAIGGELSAGRYYVLDNDINLVDEWVPIDGFAGTFDGQGHSINNLFILGSSSCAGLFSYINKEYNNITIKNVGVNIGKQGITALQQGDYFAGVPISEITFAGGLVGANYGGIISNCYATGNVTAICYRSYAGGLVGYDYGGSITNCYATGNVDALSNAGGLIGDQGYDTIITNCYRLKTQTITGSTINESGTPLSESDMRKQSSFVGWDFDTIWAIDPNVNNGYPYLRPVSENAPAYPDNPAQSSNVVFTIIRQMLQAK